MHIPRFLISIENDLRDLSLVEHKVQLKPGVSELNPESTLITLAEANFHHIKNVLRLEIGANVELVDLSINQTFSGTLISYSNKEALVLLGKEKTLLMPTNKVNLFVATTPLKTMDLIAEKSVELGAVSLCFYTAERSKVRFTNSSEIEKKTGRLLRIAEAAIKQSGGNSVPTFLFRDSLTAALEFSHGKSQTSKSNELRAICISPDPVETIPENSKRYQLLIDLIRAIREDSAELEKNTQHAEIYIIIGPEGGLAPSEIDTAFKFDYLPASLSVKTLRVETAVIAALALAQS